MAPYFFATERIDELRAIKIKSILFRLQNTFFSNLLNETTSYQAKKDSND